MAADFSHPNAQPFELESGDSALLLIHGFTGSPSHMRTVGDAVHGAGFSARGILLPGHGLSVDAMIHSSGPAWMEACVAAYREMERKYRRVAVSGLSMGGILALLLAEMFTPSACILFAPTIRYLKGINRLSPIAKHFLREMKWRPREFSDSDFLKAYDHGYAGAPLAKVEDMTRLQAMARSDLSRVTAPTLILQSHSDESVHSASPEIITSRISSTVKEICWTDKSSHVNTIGPDRAYVNDRVIDFMRRFAE
ncbi:MAG: alpha/beta fold hydrolase [Clostridia bacterium]|nr:alpha/beta fold hydrolase [Clostridia bacterium]